MNIEIVNYSEKAFAVFGETKPIKETLKELGGRFNGFLTHNGVKTPGWIFSKKHQAVVEKALGLKSQKAEYVELPPAPEVVIITPYSVEAGLSEVL